MPPFEATITSRSSSSPQISGWVRRLPLFRPTDSTRTTGAPEAVPPMRPRLAL
jgi:hypothetical protein